MKKREIDAESLRKAKAFYAAGEDSKILPGSISGLLAIHKALFAGLYDHAGQIRKLNLSKGDFRFANSLFLESILPLIEKMPDSTFDEIIAKYVELNIAHPFMEGNGRAGRIWLDILLRDRLGKVVDWSRIDKEEYLSAMRRSPIKDLELKELLKSALTVDFKNREMIFKGLEQSYYYEGLDLDDNTQENDI